MKRHDSSRLKAFLGDGLTRSGIIGIVPMHEMVMVMAAMVAVIVPSASPQHEGATISGRQQAAAARPFEAGRRSVIIALDVEEGVVGAGLAGHE